VLARLFKLPALVLDFVKQPNILDRNRSLVGKCRDQLDLLVGEWLYFRARQIQDTDWNALAQHWDAEDRAVISQSLCFDQSVFGISPYIGNMNHADPCLAKALRDDCVSKHFAVTKRVNQSLN
jgi:hypothetical protein